MLCITTKHNEKITDLDFLGKIAFLEWNIDVKSKANCKSRKSNDPLNLAFRFYFSWDPFYVYLSSESIFDVTEYKEFIIPTSAYFYGYVMT